MVVQPERLTSPVSFLQQVCRQLLQETVKKVDKLYYSPSIQLKRVLGLNVGSLYLSICNECLFHEFVHCPVERC